MHFNTGYSFIDSIIVECHKLELLEKHNLSHKIPAISLVIYVHRDGHDCICDSISSIWQLCEHFEDH